MDDGLEVITEDILSKLAYKNGLGKNLRRTTIRKIEIEDIIEDVMKYKMELLRMGEFLELGGKRLKSIQSIKLKYEKYLGKEGRTIASCFNDILSIRLNLGEYPNQIPGYLRKVDMRNGKRIDDGYRAIHLYYQKDNYHYPIEIQIWAGKDIMFNQWSHTSLYKYSDDPNIGKKIKQLYDEGKINNKAEFDRAIQNTKMELVK